ncbi:hypothetical protein [Frigoribacterium sp. UYMn621]|uniref:hypothetical protein n=1 Tax=Frigoribacterium sp. UYMn621 TaxID=3156343 RepID=UPI003393D4BE
MNQLNNGEGIRVMAEIESVPYKPTTDWDDPNFRDYPEEGDPLRLYSEVRVRSNDADDDASERVADFKLYPEWPELKHGDAEEIIDAVIASAAKIGVLLTLAGEEDSTNGNFFGIWFFAKFPE